MADRRNLEQNINDSKSSFDFIISSIQLFYIRPHVPVDIIRVFLFSDLVEYLKAKKDHSFYNTVLLKKPHSHFRNPNSLDIENNLLRQHSQKLNMLLSLVKKKKTFALHHFLKHKNCILEANVYIFLYISVRKFLFHRRSKILFGGGWVGGRLNNLFKVDGCLGFVKCFKFFLF